MFARAGSPRDELTLPERGPLRVGEGGRRRIARTDGTLEHASRLAPADLIDVRLDGTRYLFLDARGDVHMATDPIGALTTRHVRS